MRAILWMFWLASLVALLAVAPNALWLSRSSALVHNASNRPLRVRLVIADEPAQIVETGRIAPGADRFLWIDPVGEATLRVDVREGAGWVQHCGEYVEAGMYRVEITLRAPGDVACDTDLPLFSRLLIIDLLR